MNGFPKDDITALNTLSILLSKRGRDTEAREYLVRARRVSRLKGFDRNVW
jgi:hypothetical protein